MTDPIEPDPEATAKRRWREGMAAILGELESLYAADAIGAVSISIALRSGDVRHLKSYDNGYKILLISAAAIGLNEALHAPTVECSPDSWHTERKPGVDD